MNNRHSSENASQRDDRRRHDPNNGMNNIPNYESISVIYLFLSWIKFTAICRYKYYG